MIFLEPFLPLALAALSFLYLKEFREDFNRFAYLAEEDDVSLATPLNDSQINLHQQTINDNSTVIMLNPTSSTTETTTSNKNNPSTANLNQQNQTTSAHQSQQADPDNDDETGEKKHNQTARLDGRRKSSSEKFGNLCSSIINCFLRILDTHFIKLVAFMIFRLPIIDLCLLNFPFLLIVICMLKYPSTSKCSTLVASWLISIIILLRQISKLTTLRVFDIVETCPIGDVDTPPELAGNSYSYLTYFGINHDLDNPLNRVENHIYVLLLITVYSFTSIHYRKKASKSKTTSRTYESEFGIIFSGIGRREADQSLWNLMKYFLNFGFYKFGIELSCLALIIAISNRLDVVAAVYCIILTLLCITTSKKTLAYVWPILTFIVSVLIPLQFLLRLGFPDALCSKYPWATMSPDIRYWLYLPDYSMPQDKTLLYFDFLVLLAICRQAVVFRLISITSGTSYVVNEQIHHNFSAHQFKLKYLPDEEGFAVEDCFSNYSTPSNFMKSIFFISTFWITLAAVLVAGATKVSLFSLGYLIGCFIFLWLGNDAYLMPLRRLIFSWNCFIFYAALVIFTKVILQLYSCYEHTYLLNHCYILQLLRIVCYRKVQNLPPPPVADAAAQCVASLPYDELDILWDGLCLMFLLMQRVVFGSQYFRYLVLEVKAQQILASRGAELIMATQMEEAKAQALFEKEVMRNIRHKMDDLKTDNEETSKAWQRLLSLPHHHQIIRNADKHLFSSHEDSLTRYRTDDWKFKKAFIPDPLGDELERMAEINGISAVFTRWMKGQPLYGHYYSGGGNNNQSNGTSNRATSNDRELPEMVDSQEEGRPNDSGQQAQEGQTAQPGTTLAEPPMDMPRVASFDIISSDNDDGHSSSSGDGERVRNCLDTVNLIFYSILLSANVELNKLSRSYRYVSRRMAVEKNALKKHFNLNDERFKRDPTWRKWVISTLSDTYAKTTENRRLGHSNTSLNRIRSALRVITGSASPSTTPQGHSASSPPPSQHSSDPEPSSPRSPPQEARQQPQQQQQQQHQIQRSQNAPSSNGGGRNGELTDPEYYFLKLNIFTQFCRALAYVFISNTSLFCQLVIIFNQILTASLLSLPLPLLTFLWGTLSVPRPTKRFWKLVITYTEIVIVIKYVFQFPIWDWDTNNINPFYYPNLLGIRDINITYDLSLLLVLFFHRSMLKSLGQWDASGSGDESKNHYILVDVQSHSASPPPPPSSFTSDRDPSAWPTTSSNDQIGSKRPFRSSDSLRTFEQDARMQMGGGKNPDSYLENPYQNQTIEEIQIEPEQDDEKGGLQSRNCLVRAYLRTKRSIGLFFQHVLNTPYKVQTDVYTWMFLCDFINFLILIYGFWAFGSGYTNQTVASFLNENRIPFSVLIMLLAQFASIIIDRAFYLQKNIAGKLIFQVILVIAIHIWLFFALPFTTGHALTLKEYWPPKAWYVFKCIYFLLSAHQIRSGYPRRVLGNCLTKGYGYANWGAFKFYRAIPLVYDLRLYMDWIWTETTLEFRNWSLMEDMFANLFIRKCELTLEEEYPIPRARPIRHVSKYLTGGAFILLILAIIWGPLLLFSMGKTVGESNPPVEMEYELEIVGFQPILRMRATTQQISMLSGPQYDQMKSKFVSLTSQSFLGDYKLGDVAAIRLDGQSNAVWEISPPSKEMLMNRIKNNETITLKSSWTVFRIKKQKSQNFDASIAGSYQKVILGNDSYTFRESLFDMLENSSTTLTPTEQAKFVITPEIFPNYIRVPETGQATLVDQFSDNLFEYQALRPLNLSYIRMFDLNVNQTDNSTSWWKAEDMCKYSPTNDSFSFWSAPSAGGQFILEHCDSLLVITFNDRIFTGLLALLSAPGIIGLYTTFVVFFARLIRTEPSGKVIYTEIPNVDRVYGLIMDIYMARECGEYELEEKLFAKLLFLYRSPEMLIEFSRREDEPLAERRLEYPGDQPYR